MAISIMKSITLPTDQSQWQQMEIVQCIGTPDEHADKFYRFDDVGVEEHDDGQYQAYVIVETSDGEEPMMLAEGFQSFGEAVSYLQGHIGKKRVEEAGGAPAEGGAAPAEGETTPVPDKAPGADGPAEPEKKDDEKMNEEKKDEKEIKKADAGQPKNKDLASEGGASNANPVIGTTQKTTITPVGNAQAKVTKPTEVAAPEGTTAADTQPKCASASKPEVKPTDLKKSLKKSESAATPKSMRDMMADRLTRKEYGLPHGVESRSRVTIQKSANKAQYMMNRYPTTYIGDGKDATGYLAGYDTGKVTRNNEGASMKEYSNKIGKSEDDGSFASILARRQFQKAVEGGVDPSLAAQMYGMEPVGAPEGVGAPAPAPAPAPGADAIGAPGADPAAALGGAPEGDLGGAPAPADGQVPPEAGDGDGDFQWTVDTAVAVLESIPPEILEQAINVLIGEGQGPEAGAAPGAAPAPGPEAGAAPGGDLAGALGGAAPEMPPEPPTNARPPMGGAA